MNKQELKLIQENFFVDEISLKEIFSLIDVEETKLNKIKILFEGQQAQEMSVHTIPEISISELGWSDLSTPETSTEFSATARGQLMNFLKNIQGADLKEKLDSLTEFYSMDASLMEKLDLNDKAAGGKISSVLSYLVFYKTLTAILANFNAASAGFTFESFLALLLGGTQVPTNSNTIADLMTADDIPISLKLYAEASVEAGGSYRDLVNDLIKEPHYMQYVVCMKLLKEDDSGEIPGVVGSIKFYRFNFTLENIFNILSSSSVNSKRNIILPAAYIADKKSDVATQLPVGGTYPSPQEAEREFTEIARTKIEEQEVHKFLGTINFEELFKALQFSTGGDVFEGRGEPVHGFSKLGQTKVVNKISPIFPEASRKEVKELAKILLGANNELRDRYSQTKAQLKRNAAIKGAYLTGSDPELIAASVEAYNALANDEERAKALAQTLGFVGSKAQNAGHFNLTGHMVKKIASLDPTALPEGQGDAYIGEIKIGTDELQKMLSQVVSLINANIFDIFDNLKRLTTSIKTYFAGGLKAKDDHHAVVAIDSASNIEKKTKEVSEKT